MEEKLPVIGYTAWSFLDNYEWGSYGPHFGLYFVNFTSQAGSRDFYEPKPSDLERIPRPAAEWYHKLATTKCMDDWAEEGTTIEAAAGAVGNGNWLVNAPVGLYLLVAAIGCAALARRVRHRRTGERIPLLQ